MTEYSQKLQQWIDDNQIQAQLLSFTQSVHSVEEAVSASGYPIEHFTKSIAMITPCQQLVMAVVPADSRASTERVRKALALEERPRTVTADESAQLFSQKIGGNCPLNIAQATVLIDPLVLCRDWILTGGGDSSTLTKISIDELKKVTAYKAVRIRK